MNKILFKFIRFYNFFIITAILAYGIVSIKTPGEIIFLILFGGLEFMYITSYFSRYKSPKSNFHKFLDIYSFIAAWLIFIIVLIGIKSPIQVFTLALVAPLVIDLTLVLVLHSKKRPKIVEASPAEEGKVIDPDYQEEKRKLIKMFVGTSAGMLLLYLFNPKKANAAFFGSMPGPGIISIKDSGGTVIDPSTKNPFDGFGINDADEGSSTHYYGFVHYNGTDWYILKETAAGVYSYGSKINNAASDYTTAWTNRSGSLVFGTASDAF